MAQRPKDHVRAAILGAAARELAEVGFERATLATIARRAGTSVGNLYRYFSDKDALFAATLPSSFVRGLSARFRTRVRSLRGERDVAALSAAHPYRRASDELLHFAVAHRHQVLFLLRHATGTPHAGFPERLERELVALAVAHARQAEAAFQATRAQRRTLARVYRAFLASLASILAEEATEASLREATQQLTTYHLAGLGAFLGAGPPAATRESP